MIPRLNISMSKNTESIDITRFLYHDYTMINAYIYMFKLIYPK